MGRWGNQWTEADIDAYYRRTGRAAGKDSVAVPITDAKSARRSPAPASVTPQEIPERYRIKIHHRSRRLADATGRSHKACVDGLVRGGILPDDSPKYLEEITETYEKSEIEGTIIEVRVANGKTRGI